MSVTALVLLYLGLAATFAVLRSHPGRPFRSTLLISLFWAVELLGDGLEALVEVSSNEVDRSYPSFR